MPKKTIIPILWIVGVAAIAYGMLRHNNLVFIAGIVTVIIGYLMVRKHLKGSREKLKEDESGIPVSPDEE